MRFQMVNALNISSRRRCDKMVTDFRPQVKNAMDRMRYLLLQETSYHIDLPSCDGGTRSTGNVARDCFNNKRDFLKWVTSTIGPENTEKIQTSTQTLAPYSVFTTVVINWMYASLIAYVKTHTYTLSTISHGLA